jgi:hypothetical protein
MSLDPFLLQIVTIYNGLFREPDLSKPKGRVQRLDTLYLLVRNNQKILLHYEKNFDNYSCKIRWIVSNNCLSFTGLLR